jgi:hypothetical protein
VYIQLHQYLEAAEVCEHAHATQADGKSFYKNWALALYFLERYPEAECAIKLNIQQGSQTPGVKLNTNGY